MAKAGKELEIVTDLENVNLFTDFLRAKNGLVVCETYQEWAGPCMVMKRFLKKAKFEYLEGDDWDLLHYCSIKVDAVPAFKNLKGICMPTYLFFGGKKPIGIFRGYEPSVLMPLIKEMIRREKLFMSGRAVRQVLTEDMPYVFPDEDPELAEIVLLDVPFTPVKDDLPGELIAAPPVVPDENEEDAQAVIRRTQPQQPIAVSPSVGAPEEAVPVPAPPGEVFPVEKTASRTTTSEEQVSGNATVATEPGPGQSQAASTATEDPEGGSAAASQLLLVMMMAMLKHGEEELRNR
ncbi:hypothetical protein BV898_10874 [Hypsibius exemplaris]|uniref:Uncharacterized protein n=1 Tax=Hypsibius exemplaris TaxID=2072580 RepID=A0A1W0WIM6_HYPEX|nr:hypothetical protein BV898_10874 [Hypsibius exemplaris]